jgi:predicted phosphodiesterase
MNDQKLVEIVNKTIELSRELGRTPLRLELESSGISRHFIETFGYEKILSWAGLAPLAHGEARKVRHKVTNEIFRKDINQVLENRVPLDFKSPKTNSKILIAGDVHFCWEDKSTIEEFHAFNRENQPDYVVQVGDLYDMYSFSKFPRSQNLYTPKEEQRLSREGAEKFFKQIKTDNPRAKVYNLFGNHDIRPAKRTIEQMPEIEHFVERYLEELMTFEGVNLVSDHREILVIDGIGFHHGYLGKLGDHRDAGLMNMVVGHTHRGGVSYRRVRNETLWELNAGFMGDPESKVMSYTSSKLQNYTLGFGYIDKHGPRFIHK